MAMTKDCLTKLKPVVSDTVYEQLNEAFTTGDQKAWDFTMQDSHADMQMQRRGEIKYANVLKEWTDYAVKQGEEFGISPQDATLDRISGNSVRQDSGTVSLERRIDQLRGEFQAMNNEFIYSTRSTLMGLSRASNPDFVEGLVKGLFGDPDAAIPKDGQALIDAFVKMNKITRERINAAGGHIEDLDTYFLPVNHHSPLMLKAGRDEWLGDAREAFTIRRKKKVLKKGAKAEKPLSDDDILDSAFRSITQEKDDLTFGGKIGERKGKSNISTSSEQFRTLQPKSGAAWLKYTKKYGRHSNPIDAMKELIDSSAIDVAIIEFMGNNPHKLIDALVAEIKRVNPGNPRAGDLVTATFDHIRSRQPQVHDSITNTFRGLRAFQTMTKLPLAGINALNDVAHATTRSLFLGMNPVKVMMRQAKNLITSGDYKTVGRFGLLTDYSNSLGKGAQRYMESVGMSGMERGADFSMRTNGLNHWTNSFKGTFGLEFLSFMADNATKKIDKVPRGLRSAFARYGILEADWNNARKAIDTIEGVRFLDPVSDSLDGELKAKIVGMIKEETGWVVPEPNAKARAIASFGSKKNTIVNELAMTGMQFKTFGVSMMVSNIGMALDKGLPLPTKLAYFGSLIATSTVMGVVTVQLYDMVKGKEPRELDMSLLVDGYKKAGVLGIWQDLILNDPALFGGLPAQIVGPTVTDAWRIQKIAYGTKEEVFKEGGDWAGVLYPALEQEAERVAFPLKLWQVRVAAERVILDQVRRAVDPYGYDRKLRNKEDWMMEERGQGYWSTPK